LWRERVALNTIGMVALVMLAADTASLFDSGLQMTLLSVLAIAGIAAPVAEQTFGPICAQCAIYAFYASIMRCPRG
jgi:competence protein ComEC